MSKSLAFLAIGFIAASAGAGWLWHELQAERDHSNSLTARVSDLERSLKEAAARPPQVVVTTVRAPAPSPAAPAAVPAPVKVAAAAPAAANAPTPRPMLRQSQLLANSEYADAWRAKRRIELARQSGDLASAWHLSQAQVDRLLDAKIDLELRNTSIADKFNVPDADVIERDKQIADARNAYDAAVAAALGGPRQAAEFGAYEASQPFRGQVRQLQGAFAANGIEPLRDDQFNPMVDVFTTNQQQLQKEADDYSATLPWKDNRPQAQQLHDQKYLEQFAAYVKRMHDAAAAVLTPQQMQRFDLILQRQMATQRARVQMAHATSNFSVTAPPN